MKIYYFKWETSLKKGLTEGEVLKICGHPMKKQLGVFVSVWQYDFPGGGALYFNKSGLLSTWAIPIDRKNYETHKNAVIDTKEIVNDTDIIKSELENEKISDSDDSLKEESKNDQVIEENSIGFGWGNFWIFIMYFGGTAFLLLFIFSDLLFFKDLKFSAIIFFRIEYLIRSIFAIGSAWALQKRKVWALKLVFTNLILISLISLFRLIIGEILIERIHDVIPIIISYCYYVYFNKRRWMFINA